MRKRSSPERLALGLDVGGVCAKAVVLSPRGQLVYSAQASSVGPGGSTAAADLLAEVKAACAKEGEIGYVLSTGAGRMNVNFADDSASVYLCQARGACHKVLPPRALVDLGARESHVIFLDADGEVSDFMGDGGWTGGMHKLLDLLAEALQLAPMQLGAMALPAGEAVPHLDEHDLQRAESEAVLMLRCGTRPEMVAAAVYCSIARQVAKLLLGGRSCLERGRIRVTGGLAHHLGLVEALRRELAVSLSVVSDPSFSAARGAALIGQRRIGAGLRWND